MLLKPGPFFVFDVESIGLHGEGFAVGWWVVGRDGNRIASACYACNPAYAHGSLDDRIWITRHVPKPQGGYNCPRPIDVRDEFWRAWRYAKSQGATLWAECGWPVEAGFLAHCILDDPTRKLDRPYPFHEIATARLLAGFDPLATVDRLPEELPVHDPLADARQSARLLIEALNAL